LKYYLKFLSRGAHSFVRFFIKHFQKEFTLVDLNYEPFFFSPEKMIGQSGKFIIGKLIAVGCIF
jgi:hypothetical protein